MTITLLYFSYSIVILLSRNPFFIYTIYHAFTRIDGKHQGDLVLILLHSSLGWGEEEAHGRCKKEGYPIRPFPIHLAGNLLRLSHANRINFLTELRPSVESDRGVQEC